MCLLVSQHSCSTFKGSTYRCILMDRHRALWYLRKYVDDSWGKKERIRIEVAVPYRYARSQELSAIARFQRLYLPELAVRVCTNATYSKYLTPNVLYLQPCNTVSLNGLYGRRRFENIRYYALSQRKSQGHSKIVQYPSRACRTSLKRAKQSQPCSFLA